jgi:hypothetical protein
MTPSQIENTSMLFAEDIADINFWMVLKQNKNYEINDVSLIIRCVETKKEVNFFNSNGYKKVLLGDKIYKYHRLIAEMFVYNSDPPTRTCVDHIDRNTNNNIIENLQWVSPSGNNLNRSFNRNYVSIFVKSLDANARQLTHYKGNELKFQYFIANNSVYIKTETEFRQLNVLKDNCVHLKYKNDEINHTISLNQILNEQ